MFFMYQWREDAYYGYPLCALAMLVPKSYGLEAQKSRETRGVGNARQKFITITIVKRKVVGKQKQNTNHPDKHDKG